MTEYDADAVGRAIHELISDPQVSRAECLRGADDSVRVTLFGVGGKPFETHRVYPDGRTRKLKDVVE